MKFSDMPIGVWFTLELVPEYSYYRRTQTAYIEITLLGNIYEWSREFSPLLNCVVEDYEVVEQMTLRKIQAQYGDGKSILARCESSEIQLIFDGDLTHVTNLTYEWSDSHHTLGWSVGELTVLDVEEDFAELSNRPADQSECTRQSCPDIFKGHSVGCRYFK